jgi:hypothetical protein
MLALSDLFVLAVQAAVLATVAAVFWRPVAAVALMASGTAGIALALVGQGWGWMLIGGFAIFAALRALKVSFAQAKYLGVDMFSVVAPKTAPSETELLDRTIQRLSAVQAAHRARRAEAKAKAEKAAAEAAASAPARLERPRPAVGTPKRASRLARVRAEGEPVAGKAPAEERTDGPAAGPHDPADARTRKIDGNKTIPPKAVA